MKAFELIQSIDPQIKNKVSEFREERRQQQIVALFENCARCHSQLDFRYQKDSLTGLIVEHTQCLKCQEKAPSRIYKIC